MESDLDIPDSSPATRSLTPLGKSAEGRQPLPALTDNRFVHMPPFEQERRVRRQAGVLDMGSSGTGRHAMSHSQPQPAGNAGQAARTVVAAQPAMGSSRLAAAKGRGGVGNGLNAQSKRPAAAALRSEGPAKRRKPELLSASALAAIAASDVSANTVRAVAASGAVRCLPNVSVSTSGVSRRAAMELPGKPCGKEGARMAHTTGAIARKSRFDVEPRDEQACGILVPTDIFS